MTPAKSITVNMELEKNAIIIVLGLLLLAKKYIEAFYTKLMFFKVHFEKIIRPHTDISLGNCSYLNTCRHMEYCKFIHYRLETVEF